MKLSGQVIFNLFKLNAKIRQKEILLTNEEPYYKLFRAVKARKARVLIKLTLISNFIFKESIIVFELCIHIILIYIYVCAGCTV